MTEQVKPTEEQDKDPQQPAAEAPKEEAPKTEQTVGDLLQEPKEPAEKKEEETVPLSAFLELKKDLKDLQKTLKEKASNAPADIKEIATKYDLDVNFVDELASAIRTNTAKEVESKYAPLLQKQEEEKRAQEAKQKLEQVNKVFNDVYEKAIAEAPEIGKIANKDVIKNLALLPANANKTVSQLLEETYGAAVPEGKPGIETVEGAPNKEEKINFDSMSPEDAQKASTDPRLAKEYADYLIKKGVI